MPRDPPTSDSILTSAGRTAEGTSYLSRRRRAISDGMGGSPVNRQFPSVSTRPLVFALPFMAPCSVSLESEEIAYLRFCRLGPLPSPQIVDKGAVRLVPLSTPSADGMFRRIGLIDVPVFSGTWPRLAHLGTCA